VPTEHACQAAAELAAEHLHSLRPFLSAGHAYGGGAGGVDDWPLGASGLLVVLDGLRADRPGELRLWHACVGDRVREALGLAVAGTEGFQPGRPPRGWEALGLVQHRAQELLTELADGSCLGRPGELARQLTLVEDAFAGALRRLAVPAETSTRCAAALAEATGSLFGLRPPRPLPPLPPPPAPPASPARKPPLPPDLTSSILF